MKSSQAFLGWAQLWEKVQLKTWAGILTWTLLLKPLNQMTSWDRFLSLKQTSQRRWISQSRYNISNNWRRLLLHLILFSCFKFLQIQRKKDTTSPLNLLNKMYFLLKKNKPIKQSLHKVPIDWRLLNKIKYLAKIKRENNANFASRFQSTCIFTKVSKRN